MKPKLQPDRRHESHQAPEMAGFEAGVSPSHAGSFRLVAGEPEPMVGGWAAHMHASQVYHVAFTHGIKRADDHTRRTPEDGLLSRNTS